MSRAIALRLAAMQKRRKTRAADARYWQGQMLRMQLWTERLKSRFPVPGEIVTYVDPPVAPPPAPRPGFISSVLRWLDGFFP